MQIRYRTFRAAIVLPTLAGLLLALPASAETTEPGEVKPPVLTASGVKEFLHLAKDLAHFESKP